MNDVGPVTKWWPWKYARAAGGNRPRLESTRMRFITLTCKVSRILLDAAESPDHSGAGCGRLCTLAPLESDTPRFVEGGSGPG
jgi:hypothetical protein